MQDHLTLALARQVGVSLPGVSGLYITIIIYNFNYILPYTSLHYTTETTGTVTANSVNSVVVPPELKLEDAGDDEGRATEEAAGDHPLEGRP